MKQNNLNTLIKEIENNPSNYYLVKKLGDIYFNEGKYNEAVKQYSIACNYNNKLSSDIILKFERHIIKYDIENQDVLLALIYFYLEQGYEDEALYELYSMVEDNTKENKVYELIVKILKKLERKDEILEFLNKALKKGIYDNFIVDNLKELYLENGNITDSIRLLEMATSSETKNINFLKDLAELYYINNECKRSVSVYKNIVSIYPSTINDAINHINKIINLKGDDVYYHQILGDFYIRLLKPLEAVEEYKIVFENGKGNADPAIENLKKILEYYPEFIPSRFALANIYTKKRSFSEAVMEYRMIFKQQPDIAGEIIEGLNNILKDYPHQVLALQTLSNIYWEIKEKQKAIYYMDKWLNVSNEGTDEIINRCIEYINNEDENINILELLMKSYYKSNKLEKAKETAEKILNVDKNNLEALSIMSELYKYENRYDKAKELLLIKRQINPVEYTSFLSLKEVKMKLLTQKIENIKKQIETEKHPYNNLIELGINYFYSGRLIDAITYLQKSLNSKELSSNIYFYLGNCFKEFGRFDLSIGHYLMALKYSNTLPEEFIKEILFKIGMSNEALGRLEEAYKNYDRIYRLDINYRYINERISRIDRNYSLGLRGKILAGVFNNLKDCRIIVIYTKNKEEESYIKSRKKQRNLSFGQDHNDRGVEKIFNGMIQAAEEELLLAEQIDQSLVSIKNNLGLIYLMKNEPNYAKTKFEEAININKDLAVLYNNLALTYHILKDYVQAEKLYKFAMKLDKQLDVMHINLGDLKFQQGDLTESLKLWEKAEEETILPELAQRRMLAGELTFF